MQGGEGIMGILPLSTKQIDSSVTIKTHKDDILGKRTFRFDFEKNEFITDVMNQVRMTTSDNERLEQVVEKILHDRRYKNLIYPDYYGNEIELILNQDDPFEIISCELKRVYTEALIYHPFIESVRQLKWELGDSCVCVHLTYVPFIKAAQELKTKPTQHSVKQLQEVGIQPDILVLRTEREIPAEMRRKIALFCNVQPEAVIQCVDAPSIYEVPMMMHEQHIDDLVLRKAGVVAAGEPDMGPWKNFLRRMQDATGKVTIGLVGKYVELQDAYKSIDEALFQAATYNGVKLDLRMIHSEKVNGGNVDELLGEMDGVIVAPGFGQRGIEGKFVALKWCREHDVPTFGICLGMQCMVIEFARNVLGLSEANSTEMNPTAPYNVIDLMEEQKSISNLGGTMRLGAYECRLKEGSRASKAYGKTEVSERHRHRFEFNNNYREQFENAGMCCVGENPDTHLVEVVELPEKRWYIGTQYHPEYNSTVLNPNPIFADFVSAAIAYGAEKGKKNI